MLHNIDFAVYSPDYRSYVSIMINEETLYSDVLMDDATTLHHVEIEKEYPINGGNNIVLKFEQYQAEHEPAIKYLKIQNIKINSQKIFTSEGDYIPAQTPWMKEHEKDIIGDLINHGGIMGWYGKMYYEYKIQSELNSSRVSKDNIDDLMFVERIILRDSNLQPEHHK
jgi:hypothetical protein